MKNVHYVLKKFKTKQYSAELGNSWSVVVAEVTCEDVVMLGYST